MRVSRLAFAAVATAGLALAPSERIDAQASSSLSIDWYTIDAGGARSSSVSGLNLQGTIGQWDSAASRRGRLSLHGGFWPGRPVDRIFSDRFEQ